MIMWIIFSSLLLSYTSFGSDYYKKEFIVCYDNFGCVNYTKDWFNFYERSRNYRPLARDIINTRFLLLTADENSNIIYYDSISTKVSEIKSYKSHRNLMVLIHDFTSNGYTGWIKHMTLTLQHSQKYNVISVDWQEGAEPPYEQAISNARVVALELDHLLLELTSEFSLALNRIHIIGHGLGAHIAGYVGKLTNGRIGRITGLDPSGPLFEKMPSVVRLDCGDALYVEVLHTDGKGYHHQGTMQPMGHADFYFNEGHTQPSCYKTGKPYSLLKVSRKDIKTGMILPDCSHKSAFKYYIESIAENKVCSFLALSHYTSPNSILDCNNMTRGIVHCATIGLGVDTKYFKKLKYARFEILTRHDNPYCTNRYQMQITFANCPDAEEKSSGFFHVSMTDINGMRYNVTFEKILSKSKVLIASEQTTFVAWSTDPEINIVKEVKITWYFTSSFCFWCHKAICVEHMTLEHTRSSVDKEGTVKNHFCPKYQRKYAVLYNQVPCNALVICNRNL